MYTAEDLVQDIIVYDMFELHHSDLEHYGVKGMKWYQHIMAKKNEHESKKLRNKYNSIKDIDKNDYRTQKKYLKSVKRGYQLRRAKQFVKREAVAAVLAAAVGVAVNPLSAAATFTVNTALNATHNNLSKNYQEREAAQWMREEEEERKKWSDSDAGEELIHSALTSLYLQAQGHDLEHHGVKGMKWYQHIFGDKNRNRLNGPKPKREPPSEDAINSAYIAENTLKTTMENLSSFTGASEKKLNAIHKEASKVSKEYLPKVEAKAKGSGLEKHKNVLKDLHHGINSAYNTAVTKNDRSAAISALGLSDAYSKALDKYVKAGGKIVDTDMETFGPIWGSVSNDDPGVALGWVLGLSDD